jgi:hypothetical protein
MYDYYYVDPYELLEPVDILSQLPTLALKKVVDFIGLVCCIVMMFFIFFFSDHRQRLKCNGYCHGRQMHDRSGQRI